MRRVDLNVDIGEGAPYDDELILLATSANVCLGAHAGSEETTRETIRKCRDRGLRLGAHPGIPDREGRGRSPLGNPDPPLRQRWRDSLRKQLESASEAASFAYLKPHGALYNESTRPGLAADLVAELLDRFALPLMGLPGTHHEELARRAGVPFLREGYADRRLGPDGRLVPRTEPGAVLVEPVEIEAAVRRILPDVDSLCVHGDSPRCVETARLVRRVVREAGWEVGF